MLGSASGAESVFRKIYGAPSLDQVAAGQFSLNFGLWQARANDRTIQLFRVVLQGMIRSGA